MTTIKTENFEIEVLDIDPNKKGDWLIVKTDEYIPDRQKFILSKFHRDFPSFKLTVKDYDILTKLTARSKRISTWLIGAQAEYVLEVGCPKYLENLISPQEYANTQTGIVSLNKNNALQSAEEQNCAKEYKDKMGGIRQRFEKLNAGVLSNKIIRVLTLPCDRMPITLQLMIENYVAASGSASPDKHVYAREVLTQFKISLIKFFKDEKNKDFDVDLVIDRLSEK